MNELNREINKGIIRDQGLVLHKMTLTIVSTPSVRGETNRAWSM